VDIKTWNAMQVEESKSPVNFYFFWLKYQRSPKDTDEALMFYVESGGARDFAQKHRKERDEKPTSP
jgi:hypothetical protein